MNETTPQLTPVEYMTITVESEVTPELEPEFEVGESAEEADVVPPDTEPPATLELGTEVLTPGEEGVALCQPELSPPEVAVTEFEEKKLVTPEELPPLS